jgi:hypothetical protein
MQGGRVRYGSGNLSSYTSTTYYRPFICFNKRTNGEIANSGFSPYLKTITSDNVIATYCEPPNTTMYTSSYTPYMTYQYPFAYWNSIYRPSEMGSAVLGGCPRDISSMGFYIAYRYDPTATNAGYGPMTQDTAYRNCEIWLRNVPGNDGSALPTTGSYPKVYFDTVQTGSNPFIKVYDGALRLNNNSGTLDFEFDTPFHYDGTSGLEYWYVQKTRPGGPTSTHGTYMYLYYFTPTSTSTPNCTRYYYAGTSAPTNTTAWNSAGVYYKFNAIFRYVPIQQDLKSIEVFQPAQTTISDTEYNLINTKLSADGDCNPYTVDNVVVDLSNVNGAIINRINVYSTGSINSFANPTLIGYINNPTGTNVTIPTNYALAMGVNNIWVTAAIDYSTPCDATLGANLVSMRLSGDNYSVAGGDYASNLAGNIPVNYTPIYVQTSPELLYCADKADSTYIFNVLGSVRSMQWQRWNKNTSAFENISNATSRNLTIRKTDFDGETSRIRLISTPPPGECIVYDTTEVQLKFSYPISNVVAKTNNQIPTETQIYCMEDEIMMVGEYEGSAARFQWQYRNEFGEWADISMADVISAAQDTMYFTPSDKFRNTSIRFVAYSEDACNNYVISNTFPIQVYKSNQYLQQPPKVVNLCKGERFYVTVVYDGEPIIEQGWYKDGNPLPDLIYPTLDITNITNDDAGDYYYVIKSDGCKGLETLISDRVQLVVNPSPEIINIMSKARANIGEAAILKVDATYGTKEDGGIYFQWYKHNLVTGYNAIVVDNNAIKGAESNMLTVTPITESEYTYNGDYYFCRMTAPCGEGYSISEPIYLIPGANIIITRQPSSVELCKNELPTQAKLSILAFSTEDNTKVAYQWFEDDYELLDNAEFTGVNDPDLFINVTPTRTFGTFTCKAWFVGDNPYIDFKMSEPATITFKETPDISAGTSFEINIQPSDFGQNHLIQYTTQPGADVTYRWLFTDANSVTTDLGNTSTASYFIENLDSSKCGLYTLILTNSCGGVAVTFNVIAPEIGKSITDIDDIITSSLQVVPNPASHEVTFSFDYDKVASYTAEIMDIKGSSVYKVSGNTNTKGSNSILVNIAKLNLPNGTYLFQLTIENNTRTTSFIISK